MLAIVVNSAGGGSGMPYGYAGVFWCVGSGST